MSEVAGQPGPFIVRVPKTNWAGHGADLQSRLQTWEWRWKLPAWADSLVIDLTAVSYLEPWALSMFTSYALAMKHTIGARVALTLDPANPANAYFAHMDLPAVVDGGRSTDRWDEHDQNTGLHVIRTHADVTRFYNSAVRLGSGPGAETRDALMYTMAELGRNVVQHSGSTTGGVAIAQHFPATQRIQVAICDHGNGVLSSLRANYPELRTDLEALKFSLLPHVSGAAPPGNYGSSQNAGLGLFFSHEIATQADGAFWLASQRALVGIRDGPQPSRRRVYRNIEPWPGTLVVIDIPDDGVGNFAGFLEICRNLAAKAREASGPSGLDFLDEVPEVESVNVIRIADFLEDVERAVVIRESQIVPKVDAGEIVALDFAGTRFVTQSFIHALLNSVLKKPGSLARVSFVACTPSTKQAIQAVAAYAASYRQIVLS